MKIEISEMKAWHVGSILRRMRVDHEAALRAMDVDMHSELWAKFQCSYYRRSAFIDGYLAAVWGVEGTSLSSEGLVWLVLSQYALKFPVAVLRHAKAEIRHLARTKTRLVTTLVPDDDAAHRLVIFLGFQPADGFGGKPATTRSSRNNLLRYLKNNPDLMVAAGTARQVAVCWDRVWHEDR